jgi:hypothetical protein
MQKMESVVQGDIEPSIDKLKGRLFTSGELIDMVFEEPKWVIPGIIPEGLTILAGKAKTGKSWFVLGLAGAVSVGGNVLKTINLREAKGRVLFIALEVNRRRLRQRFDKLGLLGSENLIFTTEWPSGKGCLEDLRLTLRLYPDIRLVIIDTLGRVLPPGIDTNAYGETYEFLGDLRAIACNLHCAIIVTHHCNKKTAEDPYDEILGSTGIQGAVDTSIVLRRGRGAADAILHLTGRDVEEQELAIQFDESIGWILLGDAKAYAQTKERREIIDLLLSSAEPLGPKEIAEALEKSPGSIRRLLGKMEDEREIQRVDRGKYAAVGSGNFGNK